MVVTYYSRADGQNATGAMVVILGRNLNPFKRVYYALLQFDGVGIATSKSLCDKSLIQPLAKIRDLNEKQIGTLKSNLQLLLESRRQTMLSTLKASKAIPRPILPT